MADAGGAYVISPNTDPAVICRTKERGMVSIPGFMTPTEGFAAASAGADILKCFPVGRLGPGYIKDLKAVLNTPMLAVGGVGVENLREFLDAGASAVGIGSSLYRPGLAPEEIRRAAVKLMNQVAKRSS